MSRNADPESHSEPATSRTPTQTATSVPEAAVIPLFLADAIQQLAASLDYEETLVAVSGMALPYLGSWCIVDVVEQDGSMRRLGVIHPDPDMAEHARRLEGGWPPERDDPIGVPSAIRSRATELIETVSDEMLIEVAKSEENLQDLRALGIGSVVVVPLIARGRVLGAITLVSADVGHQYTDADIGLAEDLAARCAIALDNARLFRDLAATRKEAAQLNERLVISSIRQQELAEEAWDANQAKSRFLATMSHEIRTPLNAIVGYAALLDIGIAGELNPGQREYLERMNRSSDHLIALIDDVLDLAKVESGRMIVDRATFAARDAISAAIALVVPQARSAGVDLTAGPIDTSTRYVGDEGRVRQILVILLNNAVKFTERGGSVTVSCGTTQAPDPAARLEGNGPWIFIRVTDTGIGISATQVETIFQPFVQADPGRTRTRGGAGLGLAIGRDLARRMGGDLTLHSVQGEGSCFTLWLPSPAMEEEGGEHSG